MHCATQDSEHLIQKYLRLLNGCTNKLHANNKPVFLLLYKMKSFVSSTNFVYQRRLAEYTIVKCIVENCVDIGTNRYLSFHICMFKLIY